MIMNLFDSGDVLRANDGSPSRALVRYDSAQMNVTITHDHAETMRAPVIPLESVDNAIADVIVIGSRIGDLAGEDRNRLQQIGARYDPYDLVAARHRKALDLPPFHQVHDFFQGRVFGNRERLRRHDLGDLAAVLVNVISCRPARA